VGCVWCGGGGLSFALEHSKVCTLCDFGHLQFFILFGASYMASDFKSFQLKLP
jgi:hypothetical protein